MSDGTTDRPSQGSRRSATRSRGDDHGEDEQDGVLDGRHQHDPVTLGDAELHDPVVGRDEERDRTLTLLLETAAQGILSMDEHGIIVTANRALEEMFGWRRGSFAPSARFRAP